MSRQILNDHPWTEDEIKYQLDRNRWRAVEENRKMFPPGSEPVVPQDDSPAPVLSLDKDIFEYVNGMDVERLKVELEGIGIQPAGDEKAMKIALAQAFQAERDNEGKA